MSVRSKPSHFSESWQDQMALLSDAFGDAGTLLQLAIDKREACFLRSSVRAVVVSWEAFYTTSLHRIDSLLEIYFNLQHKNDQRSQEMIKLCDLCFNAELSDSELTFLYESRFDSLNAMRLKKTIKLAEKFYCSSAPFDFSRVDWRDVVYIYDMRHGFTHPRNIEDFDVDDTAVRLNRGGTKMILYLNSLQELYGECFNSMEPVLAATARLKNNG